MTYDIKEPNKISVSKILEIAMRENRRIEDGEDKIEFIHPWVVIALAECLQKAVELLKLSSRRLDGIKSELYASVYTVTDDEFETIYSVRDQIDLALAEINKRVSP